MNVGARPYLLPLQQHALLLAAQIRFSRDHALFMLALGAGLSARTINPLDVGNLSKDGKSIRERFETGRSDRRVFAANDNAVVILRESVRRAVMDHLENVRTQCPHFERPMQTTVESGGRRCATCGHEVDFMKLPLFLSRFHDRLSVRRMRSLFASYREELRLPSHLHFDSLKETYDAGRVVDLNAA